MLPSSAVPNLANAAGRHVVLSADDVVRGIAGSNGEDIVRTNLAFDVAASSLRNAPRYRPADVIQMGDVFKIGQCRVGTVAIDVIDLESIRRVSEERLSDSNVNGTALALSVPTQANEQIPLMVGVRSLNAAYIGRLAGAVSSDSPEAGHGVPTLIPDNGAPLFGRGTIMLHRDDLHMSRGAKPEAVTSSARASSCLNFTTPHIVTEGGHHAVE